MSDKSLSDELIDKLFGDGDTDVVEREGWQIENRGQAEWAMGRLAAAERQYQDAMEVVRSARERLDAYEADLRDKRAKAGDYLEYCLLEWAEQQLAKQRDKTVKLAYGSVSARHVGATVRIEDEPQLLAWIDERGLRAKYPNLVRVTENVLLTSLKAVITRTGELPPGVEPVPAYESWSVEVDDGARRIAEDGR